MILAGNIGVSSIEPTIRSLPIPAITFINVQDLTIEASSQYHYDILARRVTGLSPPPNVFVEGGNDERSPRTTARHSCASRNPGGVLRTGSRQLMDSAPVLTPDADDPSWTCPSQPCESFP